MVKNKRHCHYVCTADPTCKSVQYDEMNSVCSLYTEDVALLIPEGNSDSVFFTSPRVSINNRIFIGISFAGLSNIEARP